MTTEATLPTTTEPQEDRTTAILCYLTIIGFIVAIIMHANKKTALGSFHLRQALGMIVVGLAVGVGAGLTAFVLAFVPMVGPALGFMLWGAIWLGGLILWLIGLIAAIQGRRTPVPLIGEPIQKWFANTFT
jgi:uncharacterized membrane protein